MVRFAILGLDFIYLRHETDITTCSRFIEAPQQAKRVFIESESPAQTADVSHRIRAGALGAREEDEDDSNDPPEIGVSAAIDCAPSSTLSLPKTSWSREREFGIHPIAVRNEESEKSLRAGVHPQERIRIEPQAGGKIRPISPRETISKDCFDFDLAKMNREKEGSPKSYWVG